MSVLIQKLASEIFEILKSYGKTLILYDSSGNVTYDPEQATRIFISPEKMMLSITNDGDDNEVKLYLSNSVILSDQMKLINTLRQVSTRLNSLFNVRKYGKELSPKDFAYQVTTEGLHEAYWGSLRTSYSNIGDCKIIIHHNSPVNEEKRGSRSRDIKNIYIENNKKEKLLLPSNNIHAAKALARHISSGGKIYDKVGDYIIECSKEYDILKLSLKNIKNTIADDNLKNTIIKTIKERVYDINRTFDIIRGSRNYKKYNSFFSNKSLYEFTTYDIGIEQDVKNNITSNELDNALPYIISLLSNKKSLLPKIEIIDGVEMLNFITMMFKRKFKYGIDYIIIDNTFIFYNPSMLTDIIYTLDKNKINYKFISIQDIDNKKITNTIEVFDIRTLENILTTELGLELGIDYIIDGSNIKFLSSNIYADVVSFLNTTNIDFIDLSEQDIYNKKKDINSMADKTDKVYQFSKEWLDKNTDGNVSFSSEDSVHDREMINNKAESLSNELKSFMKCGTISGIDTTPRKFNDKRSEQSYKISAVASSSGLHGDMIFNFLTNIAEKIRNKQLLDNNEKAIAKKAIEIFDKSLSSDETDLQEDGNPNDFHNIVSLSWNSEIPEKLQDILEKIPFGILIATEGNNRRGYINYEIKSGQEDLFNRSVNKYILNYGCDHIVKISGTKEVKKPMSNKPSKWKQFLGFKEEIELDEWFAQFDPEKTISEDEETEEDFIIDPKENEDELLLSDDPDIEISISESIFSDGKTEDTLCSYVDDIKNGSKLSFAYIDDGGKFVIYDETTNTPIKEYKDEEVADKICDMYNGTKYEQAKNMVLSSLEKSIDDIRKAHDEEELNEQEIREKAVNKKINDYAISQYSPSYEIDVNRSFGLERHVPVAEQFSFITAISEHLFQLARKNKTFENYQYTPYIFESSAVDIFNSEIKPRLKECGFVFISDAPDDEEEFGFEREPNEQDIIRATREYNDIINGGDLDVDLSEGELDDVINDSSRDFNIEEYYDKSYLNKFKKGELPVHILDSKVAKDLYHEAENKGLLDKVDFTLAPNNFMGRASQIVSEYINNLYEKDLGKPGKNFDKIAKSAGKEYGSKEAGEKVAGAVLSKLRKDHPEEYKESVDSITSMANVIDKLNGIFDKPMFEADYEHSNNIKLGNITKIAVQNLDLDSYIRNGYFGEPTNLSHREEQIIVNQIADLLYKEAYKANPSVRNSAITPTKFNGTASRLFLSKKKDFIDNGYSFPEDSPYTTDINEADDESPYDIARRMGYQAAKNGKTDTFNAELHSMLDDTPGSKHNKAIHSAFMQGMSDYENENNVHEDLEDETLDDSDVTIPTNVQTTFKNDVSSDIMDNPDMDMINDIRRRAGLI